MAEKFWEKDSNGRVFLLLRDKKIPVGSVIPHEDYVAVEEHLRKSRPNPFDAIKDELEKFRNQPEIVDKIIAQAYGDKRRSSEEQRLSRQEVKDWMETWDGFSFIFKRVCARNGVSITDAEIFEFSQAIPLDQIQEALDEASKENLRKYTARV